MAALTALRRSPLRWPILVGLVALMLIGIGFSSTFTGAARATPSEGTLTIDGTSYDFAPTACTITDKDFVVSGPGGVDESEFFVTASSGSVELAFGIDSEIDTPAQSAMWLSSVDDIDWSRTGNSVTASLMMIDRHDAEAGAVEAALAVDCSSN